MATERLYYHDTYQQNFTSAIIRVDSRPDGRHSVVLDRTLFYPEAGGQPFDTGYINNIAVLSVEENGDEILHIMDTSPESGLAYGVINWPRRYDHMQQHTGEHILSAAFHKLLAADNVGFHLGANSSQIDLNIPLLSPEQALEVERLANDMVFANKSITSQFVAHNTLASFSLRKEPVKAFAAIRLVEAKDIDCCPCGGTHVAATGEVGLIKILSWSRKNNAVRVDFVCGRRALADYQHKNNTMNELSRHLSSPTTDLLQAVEKQLEKFDSIAKQLVAAKQELTQYLASDLYQKALETNGLKVIVHNLSASSPTDLAELAKQLLALGPVIILLGGANPEQTKVHLFFACTPEVAVNMGAQLKSVLALVNGKGGGNNTMAQGGGSDIANIQSALDQAKKNILAILMA